MGPKRVILRQMDGGGKSWSELWKNVRTPSPSPSRVVDLDDEDGPSWSLSPSVFEEEEECLATILSCEIKESKENAAEAQKKPGGRNTLFLLTLAA